MDYQLAKVVMLPKKAESSANSAENLKFGRFWPGGRLIDLRIGSGYIKSHINLNMVTIIVEKITSHRTVYANSSSIFLLILLLALLIDLDKRLL